MAAWRTCLRFTCGLAAAALTFVAALLATVAVAAAADLRAMSAPDIRALQQRLADARCYAGAIDGTASAATEAAVSACPVMDPILRIETGMHTALIRRIGVDRECRLLASGSDDKTVRLWSMPEGRLLRTLRPPVGAGNDGKVFAVAVSPDGRLVAAGGWDARWSSQQRVSVYLFDAATGALRARVGDFEDVINHLAFSPDGRFLAATLGAGKGLRVVDTEHMREVAADRDYGDHSSGAAFAPDGRLFTVAYDGYLRAYDPAFRLVRKAQTRGGRRPLSIAVDPTGERLAVGYQDGPAVEVYKTSDLSFAFAAETTGIAENVGSVTWSSDGRQLVAGGVYGKRGSDGVWRYPVVRWDRGGRGARHEQAVAPNTIQHILPCGTGFAVGASGPLFALLDRDGTPRLSKSGVAADMRAKLGDASQVSRDGHQVRFGLGIGNASPALFDLARATLSRDANAPGLAVPKITGIAVTDWEDKTAPKFAGKELKLDQYETSRSLAITPDGARFVLGTEYRLRAYDAQGREQWKRPVPGVGWGANVTGDGRLVLAAYADGTIRWHRISDGQELLALFVDKDGPRWVAWTPSGYYMASPGGEDLIGWHVNRGWDQAADFFPASRFRERFSRSDVVQKVLDTLDEGQAVKQANAQAGRREETKPLLQRLPPVISIVSPADGARFPGATVDVGYTLRSPSGLPVDRVDVLVDGRQVETRGLARFEGKGEEQRSVSVPVPARDVEIGLIARSGDLVGEAARVRLAYAGPASADLLKPKLYALVVGVSDYADANYKLGFAAKDARDFAAALSTLRGGLYADVEVRLAADRDVTRSSVVEGLVWLQREVTSHDVGLLFLAGHGVTDEEQAYWFLPADATPERLQSSGVSQDDLRRSLRRLAGKALFFLDTCHAGRAFADDATRRGVGRVDINGVINDFASAENGVVTFASSTGRELSLERPEWGNGAFTKAILEGLFEGRADLLRNGTITLSQLDAYVADRVKKLTGGVQHPIMIRPSTVPDFPIALAVAR